MVRCSDAETRSIPGGNTEALQTALLLYSADPWSTDKKTKRPNGMTSGEIFSSSLPVERDHEGSDRPCGSIRIATDEDPTASVYERAIGALDESPLRNMSSLQVRHFGAFLDLVHYLREKKNMDENAGRAWKKIKEELGQRFADKCSSEQAGLQGLLDAFAGADVNDQVFIAVINKSQTKCRDPWLTLIRSAIYFTKGTKEWIANNPNDASSSFRLAGGGLVDAEKAKGTGEMSNVQEDFLFAFREQMDGSPEYRAAGGAAVSRAPSPSPPSGSRQRPPARAPRPRTPPASRAVAPPPRRGEAPARRAGEDCGDDPRVAAARIMAMDGNQRKEYDAKVVRYCDCNGCDD